MSRLAVLSLALLLSSAGPAMADPSDGRRGGRGEWRGEHRGDGQRGEGRAREHRGRADGERGGGDRGGDGGARRFEGGGGPPVTSDEPGRGQRSWADRPRYDGAHSGQGHERDSRGDRYGLEGGPGSGQRWTERGRDGDGRDGDNDRRQRDYASPRESWRGDHDGRDRGEWRGDDGRRDDWRRDDGRRHEQWRDDGRRHYGSGGDDRWRGRPGYGRELRGRDHGRHWYEPHRYHQHYRAHVRYRAPYYVFPRGYYPHSWRFGEVLPHGWYGARYYLDWRAFDLPYPPIGCEWVRVGRDALLVDVWTGEILSVYYDLFW